MEEISTEKLNNILLYAKPDNIEDYLAENKEALYREKWPFGEYMKETLHEKGIRQQDVFLSADISDSYGYKIISGEKHTAQRDLILRLCFGGKFSLEETQKALKLYGMAPLYSKIPRDAVLMVAFNSKIYDIWEVDALLSEHKMKKLFHFNT